MSLKCCACTEIKVLDAFSINQKKKESSPRCKDCVAANRDVVTLLVDDGNSGSHLRCSSCKTRKGMEWKCLKATQINARIVKKSRLGAMQIKLGAMQMKLTKEQETHWRVLAVSKMSNAGMVISARFLSKLTVRQELLPAGMIM